MPQSHRSEGHRNQGERWEYALPSHESFFPCPEWKNLISRSCVVLAIHPRDGHEVGELPEKENHIKQPCLRVQLPGGGEISDQHWHGARKGANKGAPWRSTFKRRIENQIPRERQQGKQARTGTHRQG